MLSPEQAAIGKALVGYEPLTEEEGIRQYDEVPITYLTQRKPKVGDVKRDEEGRLHYYWEASDEHPDYPVDEQGLSYAYTTQGWYEIPSYEDVESWTFDEVCYTPDDVEVEPDHQDSWLRLLGLI